jgi:hypothetical protein
MPFRAWTDPFGLQEFVVPGNSKQSANEGDKVDGFKQRPPLLPRKNSWYSFLLKAEPTPWPLCGQMDYVIGNRTRWLPACIVVPQPTALVVPQAALRTKLSSEKLKGRGNLKDPDIYGRSIQVDPRIVRWEGMDLIHMFKYRDWWKALLSMVKILRFPWNCKYLEQMMKY